MHVTQCKNADFVIAAISRSRGWEMASKNLKTEIQVF